MRTALEWASTTFAQDDLLAVGVGARPLLAHAWARSRGASVVRPGIVGGPDRRRTSCVPACSGRPRIRRSTRRTSSSASAEPRPRSSSPNVSATSARSPGAWTVSPSLQQYSDPAGAQPTFLEAAALAEAQGDIWNQIDCLQKAAYSDYYRDRWPEAIDGSIEVERLASSIGNRLFLSYNDLLYGTAAWRQGHWEEAKRRLREALDVALELGEPMTIASPGNAAVLDRDPESETPRPRRASMPRCRTRSARSSPTRWSATCWRASRRSRSSTQVIPRRPRPVLERGVRGPAERWRALPDLAVHVPCSRSHRWPRVTIGRRSTRSTGSGASPTTCRAPPRPPTPTERPRCWLAVRGDRISPGRSPAARSPATSGSGSGCSATETLELIGGTLVDLGNAARLGSGCSPRRRRSRRTTAGDRRGAASALTGDADIAAAAESRSANVLRRYEAEGAALTLEQAAELAMRAHGTRKRPATGWASLSPTELEVVALVAEGKTNPEIASALTISRATVKTHVSHVLTKLALGSRSEIAAEFARSRFTRLIRWPSSPRFAIERTWDAATIQRGLRAPRAG